jgi:vancomycin permeability regulator SanA
MKLDVKKIILPLVLLAFGLILTFMIASYASIGRESDRVFEVKSKELEDVAKNINIGIVFGGGVTDNEPRPLLKERLDTAKELLDNSTVNFLILSGDNRTLNYNEPAVMYDYLVNDLGVDPDKLQMDFAGRSTYETCERASKIFGVQEAILVSESTHLPRAAYLCRHFGIDAYGAKSDGEASSGLRVGQRWREILARSKAILNVYFIGENTILGDPIKIN